MSEASAAEPIKVGFLIDYLSTDATDWTSFAQPLELVFRDGLESNMIDRPGGDRLPRRAGPAQGDGQGGHRHLR